jgi:DNA-binding CsgD family transcriptional regulator
MGVRRQVAQSGGGRRGGDGFAAAIEAIYCTAAEPSRWPEALQALAEVFGDLGAVLLHQRDDGSFGTIISTGLSPAAQAEYEREWWRQDIRSFRALERGFLVATDAITDRHVVTAEEVKSHPIYTDFLVPNGMGWFAAITICPDPHTLAWISIQRAMSKPPFADDELELLTRLGTHAERALRLGIRLIDAELRGLTLADALSHLSAAVFLLDGVGKVLFMNASGERLIGQEFLLRHGRLTMESEPERLKLEKAVEEAAEAGFGVSGEGPRPIVVGDGDGVLAVYVFPARLPPRGSIERSLAGARVVVLAVRSRTGVSDDPSLVRDLLGLTLGEARVASLIGSGLLPRTAAERLGISEETARKTLKKVFAKVGISRQSELSVLLSKLVLH